MLSARFLRPTSAITPHRVWGARHQFTPMFRSLSGFTTRPFSTLNTAPFCSRIRTTHLTRYFYSTRSDITPLNPSNESSAASSRTGTETPTKAEAEVIAQDRPAPPEPRLSLTFTCTASVSTKAGSEPLESAKSQTCGMRSTHEFTRRAYERGIVLVQCPTCLNRHLIADHLGWFKESTQDGKLRTVEELMKARGENVRRGRMTSGTEGPAGVVEYYEQ